MLVVDFINSSRWLPEKISCRLMRSELTDDQSEGANIKRANSTDTKGRTVDHFEIETWRWDFRNEPQSPTYGKLVNSVIYPVSDNGRKSESPIH